MNKKTKNWLIIGASLLFVGCILFGGAMSMLKWDFKKLSTTKYETNKYEISDEYFDIFNFENISLKTNIAKVMILPSENDKTTVICYERQTEKHSVSIKDNTLFIEMVDSRKWYEYIGINFETPEITIYIPKQNYGELSIITNTGDVEVSKNFNFKTIDITTSNGDVKNYASALESIKIKATTGNINFENASADSIDFTVSTGNIIVSKVNCIGDINTHVSTGKMTFSDVNCDNFTSKGNTGSILLNSVIAENKFNIQRSTGKILFEMCDAGAIVIETDTGDVKGTLLTDKVFTTKTDTGKVKVPQTVSGGICEITTDTGDIEISIINNNIR